MKNYRDKGFIKTICILLTLTLIFQSTAMTPTAEIISIAKPNKYDVSEVIIKFKDGYDFNKIRVSARIETGLLLLHSNRKLRNNDSEVLDVGKSENVQTALDILQKLDGVEYVSPNFKLASYNYSDEPLFANQWGLKNDGQIINGTNGVTGYDVNAVSAWDISKGDNVIVGVMDTGIDINHPDLQSNIFVNSNEIANNNIDDDGNGYIDDLNGWDFANNDKTVFDSAAEDSHGTGVAGVIGAVDNATGIIGVAPNVKLLPLKFIKGDTGYTSDAIDAIEYAKTLGVKIMNCSWGSEEFNFALKDTMNNANMTFICAAGNGGSGSVSYPAAYGLSNVISIGAIDNAGRITTYSNSGSSQDLYAPGSNVLTTNTNATYNYVNGTSFSAAYVSGIAALVNTAVSDITVDEMKLVLKSGYTEKGINKLKVADSYVSVKNALPINFLKDEDGRLSRAMKYAQKLIDGEVAEIFTKHVLWNELDDPEKTAIINFFDVTSDEMNDCFTEGLDIIDSAIALLASKRVNLTIDEALTLLELYADNQTFDNELEGLCGLLERIELTATEKAEIVAFMQNGYKISQVASALIASKAIDKPLSDLIRPVNADDDFSNLTYSFDEKEIFIQTVQRFNLDTNYISEYLDTENHLPSQLSLQIFEWQKTNNLFVVGNTVTPFSTAIPESPGFNKYKVSTGNAWSANKVQIDKTDGMLTLSQPLINLAGINGLDLNLGLRFDSEVADAVINANYSDNITHLFKVTEVREYYYKEYMYPSGYVDHRCESMDETITHTGQTESQMKSLKASDGADVAVGPNYHYIIRITGTAKTSGDINATGLANFYDDRYNLGIGWAIDFPTIEILESTKYLHLPGGIKYKINSDNTLDGFTLTSMGFYNATGADFTVNGVSAAYKIFDINNNYHYFDTAGKYLGTKDYSGNTIKVYYNANGLIEKIYDTSNRYIKFTYETVANTSRTVTIELVDNDSSNPETKSLYIVSETYNVATGKFIMTSIEDSLDRTTSFGTEVFDSTISFNSNSCYDSPTITNIVNKTVYLTSVTEPTGAYTKFDYDEKNLGLAYGYASARDYMRVKDAYLKTSSNATEQYNNIKFFYEKDNNYWRFEADQIWPLVVDETATNYSILERVKDETGDTNDEHIKEEEVFDNSLRQIFTRTYKLTGALTAPYSNLSSQTEIVSFDDRNQPTEIMEKSFDLDDASKFTCSRTLLTWDSFGFGNVISSQVNSGDSLNGLSTIIDSKKILTYNPGLSKSIPDTESIYTKKPDSGQPTGIFNGIKYNRTISMGTRKVTRLEKLVYDYSSNPFAPKVLAYEDYTYLTNGNLEKIKTTYSPDNLTLTDTHKEEIEKWFTYDDKYSTYFKDISIKDVHDIDGNHLKKSDGNATEDITNSAEYDMLGRTTATIDPNNCQTQYSYNDDTGQTSIEYPNGGTQSTEYDFTNRFITTTNMDGTRDRSEYDVFGNLVKTYRKNTNATETFDLLSENTHTSTDTNLIRQKTSTQYLWAGKYNITTNTYDWQGRVTNAISKDETNNEISNMSRVYNFEDGSTTKFNSVETIIDVGGTGTDILSKNYLDGLGRTLRQDSKASASEIYTDTAVIEDYDVISQTTGETITTINYEVDDAARDSKTNIGLNESNNNSAIDYLKDYDGLSRQITSTDANGNTTINTYDKLGRVIKVDTPFAQGAQNTIIYATSKTYYNAGGQVAEQKQKNNEADATTETYSCTKYTNNSMGQIIKTELVIDANNSQFSQNYFDGFGRLRRVYTGLHAALTINGLDDVTTNGDTEYSVIKYDYDFYGNLTTYTDALNATETFTYYDFSNLLHTKTLRNGVSIHYDYYNSGNIKEMTGAKTGKTTITRSFTYDKAGNVLTATENNSTSTTTDDTITYTYDGMGRCVSESYTQSGNNYSKYYDYDGKDLRSFEIYKNSARISGEAYDYNSNGRLSKMFVLDQSYYQAKFSVRTNYDNNGNVISKGVSDDNDLYQGNIVDANGIELNYVYNLANQVKTLIKRSTRPATVYNELYTSWQEDYGYKLDGNLTGKVSRTLNYDSNGYYVDFTYNNFTDYTYDNANRLTDELYGTYSGQTKVDKWKNHYTFDDYNNQQTKAYTDYSVVPLSTDTTYTYNAANRLTDETIRRHFDNYVLNDYDYTYDNAGNMLTKKQGTTNKKNFTYDAINRTTSVQIDNNAPISYEYNALDQRVKKVIAGGVKTVNSIWNGSDIAYDDSTFLGNPTKTQYTSGNYAFVLDGISYYSTSNPQGDVLSSIKDSNGSISSNEYNAYGNRTAGTIPANPKGYRGEYTDSETGLIYLRARYYDPSIGRFTQEDTYRGDNIQMNFYGYCSGNPVMFTDPSGYMIDEGGGFNSINMSSPRHAGIQGTVTLKRGSRGEDVERVQRFLGIQDDGSFGPVTEAAVISYQRGNGLQPDGRVGPATRAHMNGSATMTTASEKTNQTAMIQVKSTNNIKEKPFIENFKNNDGSYSFYDNRRHNPNNVFHEQILSVKVTTPSASLIKNGKLTFGSYKATFMTGGWEWKHVNLSLLDFGSAKFAAGIHENKFELSLLATIWDPSISFKFGGCKIDLTANVGSIGGDFNIGKKSFRAAGAYGWGAGLSVEWE